MNRKMVYFSLFFLLLLLGNFFLFQRKSSHKPHFPSYDENDIVRIIRDQGEYTLFKEGDKWLIETAGVIWPAEEGQIDRLLSLPAHIGHRIGSLDNYQSWLSGATVTYHYLDRQGQSFSLDFLSPNAGHVGSSEALIYLSQEKKSLYLIPGEGQLSSTESGSEFINQKLLPFDLEGWDIVYYSLYTPKEGSQASQFRYSLSYDESENWSLQTIESIGSSEPMEFSLSRERISLLQLRLSQLEGDIIIPRSEGLPGNIRFTIEIHDNRGNRYIFHVGDQVESDSNLYYVSGDSDYIYLLAKDRLAEIAQPVDYFREED